MNTKTNQDLREEIAKMYVDDMLTWGLSDEPETIYEERMENEDYKKIVYGFTDQLLALFNREIKQREKAYCKIFKWLNGETDFRERQEGEGAYWWRKELRQKLKTLEKTK